MGCAVARLTAAGFLLLAAPVMAAEPPAELISSFRLKHGQVRVARDATLDRIALEQARAMAAKDHLSHEVLGPFTRRIAPVRAGRAAENIAYGYESFEKTLGQWIDSSGHRRTCCCPMPLASDSERQGCKRQAHLLGHGDRRRLRAEAGQWQEGQGASCCCET